MKKIKKGIVFGAFLLASTSLQAGLTICNKYSCQSAHSYNQQEILNTMAQMFARSSKEILFCDANPAGKICYEKPIDFSGRSNLVGVQFQIPFARIFQLQLGNNSIQMALDYQIRANQYYPQCRSSDSKLSFSVSHQGDFLLESPPFHCQITELGETKMSLRFKLDYLDLDNARLGGTYETLVQGDVLGGGSGYALLNLSEKRVVEPARLLPTEFTSEEGYSVYVDESGVRQRTPHKQAGLVDWDMNNIKTKWNSFKEKFLKILYLEPLDD